ncbi:MAG: gliding motility lipoprotein GldD [Bacteroidales bacterium]
MKRNWSTLILFCLLLIGILYSCENTYTPKPTGYFRIDLPKKEYQSFDTTFPYSFEYPKYAKIVNDQNSPDEKYWINIVYPQFKGEIHLTYRKVNDNLTLYLQEAHNLVYKHMQKATAIRDNYFSEPDNNIYGITYEIEGVGAASPFQFVLTDSTSNYLRGALYFDVKPNNDSLSPVINFVEEDILHLIKTFKWKEETDKTQNHDKTIS